MAKKILATLLPLSPLPTHTHTHMCTTTRESVTAKFLLHIITIHILHNVHLDTEWAYCLDCYFHWMQHMSMILSRTGSWSFFFFLQINSIKDTIEASIIFSIFIYNLCILCTVLHIFMRLLCFYVHVSIEHKCPYAHECVCVARWMNSLVLRPSRQFTNSNETKWCHLAY